MGESWPAGTPGCLGIQIVWKGIEKLPKIKVCERKENTIDVICLSYG